ncbi:Predicted metal-dependent phosphohydrolase, HD superfamily [Lishizhenia tianjinensis]|uniref:Predicted metal-dependent phosphohydrolase, HD superfamily n=2 Tax=Lishizhenia tianjinensis TaxID=477690 RepID=A0A1I7B4U9_9FLAO|nr:Predicted metal-dependent phosphohydrolase, HD superfamily [Lishizhenia tianjinensis]
MEDYTSDQNYVGFCWNELQTAYTASTRFYHNLSHLENMFVDLDEVKEHISYFDAVAFAMFYHDIVYDAAQQDNEYQSAVLFKERIGQTSFSEIDKVFRMIEETKFHGLSEDNDTNFLMDIDLAILGQSLETYKRYYQNIRKEYQIYPDEMYQIGRTQVLNKMLEAGDLFKTDYFKAKYEEQAKENILLELSKFS